MTQLAYQVLARRYRPLHLADLKGQAHLVAVLSQALLQDRLHHAYILTGTRGVGKTTTARIIAALVNCQSLDLSQAIPKVCGTCPSCLALETGSHMDILEFDAASKTGVDDMREIIESLPYRPVLGRKRVFIIDEVHMLSKSAFNALLKTLEEPPAHVMFIFATTEVRKIPLTILSRCQRFDLRHLSVDELAQHLTSVALSESFVLESEAGLALGKAARGSVRDGLSLLDQALILAGEARNVSGKIIQDMLGKGQEEEISALMQAVFQGQAVKAFDLLQSLRLMGMHETEWISLSMDYLAEEIKDRALTVSKADGDMGISINSLHLLWSLCLRGLEDLRKAPDILQAGDMTLLRLLYVLEEKKENPDLKQKKNSNLNKVDLIVDHPSDPEAESPALSVAPSQNILLQSAADLIQVFLERKEQKLAFFLQQDVIFHQFTPLLVDYSLHPVSDQNLMVHVRNKLKLWFEQDWVFTEQYRSDEGSSLAEIEQSQQQELRQKIIQNPFMRDLQESLPKTEILSIKPKN